MTFHPWEPFQELIGAIAFLQSCNSNGLTKLRILEKVADYLNF